MSSFGSAAVHLINKPQQTGPDESCMCRSCARRSTWVDMDRHGIDMVADKLKCTPEAPHCKALDQPGCQDAEHQCAKSKDYGPIARRAGAKSSLQPPQGVSLQPVVEHVLKDQHAVGGKDNDLQKHIYITIVEVQTRAGTVESATSRHRRKRITRQGRQVEATQDSSCKLATLRMHADSCDRARLLATWHGKSLGSYQSQVDQSCITLTRCCFRGKH
jgi:hypothetical protein